MHSTLASNPAPQRRPRSVGRRSPATVFLTLIVLTLAGSATALARQDPQAQRPSAEERRQRLEERRQQRAEAAAEMRERRNDPDFLKANAWWNDSRNVEAFGLTEAQRKTADDALAAFLTRREQAGTKGREAQTAFFEALATGAPDLQAKKERMITAMTAMTAANADLRIAVFGALTDEQRAQLQSEKPRILRSNWADPRGGGSDRRLQRRRGSDPNP